MTFVSVLLPVRNGAEYLERAARSILNQTHADLELLVLDDGSTDGSAGIAASLGDRRVRLLRNERNQGLPATLNLGLSAAKAEIVARQDADDVSHPQRLERQVKFLDSNPAVGLLGTQAWRIDEHGRCRGSVAHACDHDSLVWELLFDNAFVHTSVAFRRHIVVGEQGGYDEAWPYNQDYELWARLARSTRIANLPQRLVAWRSHGASMTSVMGQEAARANRVLLARNLPSVLGETSGETVELVARAREGLDLVDLRRLLPLMKGWADEYRARVAPQSLNDFRSTLVRQYLQMAFTRHRRTPARIVLALWAGREEGTELMRAVLTLAAQRARLGLGHDPVAAFGASAV